MFSGGTRNQNNQDGMFFLKEQAGGWNAPTVSGGGGFQASGWNTPAPANSDSQSAKVDFEPIIATKPTTTKPAATTTPKTASYSANLGEALAGATAYQSRPQKNPNPWAAENSGFDMGGVGDLMGMVTRARAMGG